MDTIKTIAANAQVISNKMAHKKTYNFYALKNGICLVVRVSFKNNEIEATELAVAEKQPLK